jgi:hypothetical protein
MLPQLLRHTNAPNAREIFREKPLRPDTGLHPLIEKLMQCPPSATRTDLLSRFYAISEEIQAFLNSSKAARITELEQERGGLWVECRTIKDEITAHVSEIARLQSLVNFRRMELSGLGTRVAELQDPSTNLPAFYTPKEEADWLARKNEAELDLAARQEEIRSANPLIMSAQGGQQEATERLRVAVEKLRSIDSELNRLK